MDLYQDSSENLAVVGLNTNSWAYINMTGLYPQHPCLVGRDYIVIQKVNLDESQVIFTRAFANVMYESEPDPGLISEFSELVSIKF